MLIESFEAPELDATNQQPFIVQLQYTNGYDDSAARQHDDLSAYCSRQTPIIVRLLAFVAPPLPGRHDLSNGRCFGYGLHIND
jgi:hypothetical protein